MDDVRPGRRPKRALQRQPQHPGTPGYVTNDFGDIAMAPGFALVCGGVLIPVDARAEAEAFGWRVGPDKSGLLLAQRSDP